MTRSCSFRKCSLRAAERALFLGAVMLGGCATLDAYRYEPAQTHLNAPARSAHAECMILFQRIDGEVDAAGVRDAGTTIVDGYPYLRTDRFTASFAAGATADPEFGAWVARMQHMDAAARAIELANLDRGRAAQTHRLDRCRALLSASDLGDAAGRSRLRAAVEVPPDYVQWQRALGLYPLTRIAFATGIRNWQAQTRAAFAADPSAPPALGRPTRYAPARRESAGRAAAALARAPRDALGVPVLSDAQRELVFAAYAPDFVVNVASDDDRIGALVYAAGGRLRVDAAMPTVYRRIAYTRYGGRVLLQLVYSVWFAARPAESAFDSLSGALDGVIWRVTLAEDGTPLVFDSIHQCGCYHLFFPTPLAIARERPDSIDEWMFSPQALPRVSAADRITVSLAAVTHYLHHVSAGTEAQGETVRYAFAPDDQLRSLPLPGGGRRSAFGPDGIVPGSERGERAFYWPMGVRSAGAMRQWGTHATAFVGTRHFDDPDLVERYFMLPPPAGTSK